MEQNVIWKDILGYEGLYTINNYGIVKNNKGRTIKPFITEDGYLRTTLFKNYSKKHFLVHRLVAMAFIPNPNKFPIINHKDENKKNNYVSVNMDGSVDYSNTNLEWCTFRYNITYNDAAMKRTRNISFKVNQYDLNGRFISSYSSLREAERITGVCACNISLCCKHSPKYKHAGGYIWKFDNDTTPIILLPCIVQLSENGTKIGEFKNVTDASKKTNIHESSIRNCMAGRSKLAGGFIWRRERRVI